MKNVNTGIISVILTLFILFSAGLVCAEDGWIDASNQTSGDGIDKDSIIEDGNGLVGDTSDYLNISIHDDVIVPIIVSTHILTTSSNPNPHKLIEDGLLWLRTKQQVSGDTGSWSYGSYGPNVGITSLAVTAFLDHGYDESDETVRRGINFILSKKHADGSIGGEGYAGRKVYTTSMATIALVAADRHNEPDKYTTEISDAVNYLLDAQNSDGGWGYDKGSRSDLSNGQWVFLALDEASLPKDHSVWNSILPYVESCQNTDGGFTYTAGGGNSYGTMTTAGLWGLLVCPGSSQNDIDRGFKWLTDHYSITGNPGTTATSWYYYYLVGLSKACTLGTVDKLGTHDWYAELVDHLASIQNTDGSWSVNTNEPDQMATAETILTLERYGFCVSPDVTLSSSDINISYIDENKINITATIHNKGAEDASDVVVQFFDQDTIASKSDQIGSDQAISIILSRHAETVSVIWDAPELIEYHNIVVSIDPYNTIPEWDEGNNMATKEFAGHAPVMDEIIPTYKGAFIRGIEFQNPITATVSDPDGADDIARVVFSFAGSDYVDVDGSDGWTQSLNMSLLSDDTKIVVVKAYDNSGLESRSLVYEFSFINLPSWLVEFLPVSYVSGGDVKYSFSKKFPPPPAGKKKFEWDADIPESIPVIGGKNHIKFSSKVEAGYKVFSGESSFNGSVSPVVKLMGRDADVDFGVEGVLDRNLAFKKASAYAGIKVNFTIPTQWGLEIPYVGKQGLFIIITPHGEIAAVWEVNQDSQGRLEFRDVTGELGLKARPTFFFGDEDGVLETGVQVYVFVDGAIVVIYVPPTNVGVDRVTASVGGGIKAKVWPGWEWEAELGPWSYDLYSSSSLYRELTIDDTGGWKLLSYNDDPYYEETAGFAIMSALHGDNNTIINDPHPDNYPYVTTDTNGNTIAVWVHVTNISSTPPTTDVYYSRRSGTTWSNPQSIVTNDNLELHPTATYDSNGNVMAVWINDKLSPTAYNNLSSWMSDLDLFYSVYNGTSWSVIGQITDNSITEGIPSISADKNGNIIAVWTIDKDNNISTSNDMDLHYSVWNGSDWSVPDAITNDNLQDSKAIVKYNSSGYAIALWSRDMDGNSTTDDDKEIVYSSFDGSSWSAIQNITNNDRKDSMPTLAFDSNDDAIAVWVKHNTTTMSFNETNTTTNVTNTTTINVTNNELSYSKLPKSSQHWSGPECVGIVDHFIKNPTISFDGRNNAIMVWRGYGYNGNGDILYAVMPNNSSRWTARKALTDNTLINWKPSMSVDSNNNAVVVWLSHNTTIQNNESISDDDDVYYLIHPIAPDLTLDSSDINFSKTYPSVGETVVINATIHNIGDLASNSTTVQFFDGNPDANGTQIGTNQTIGSLAPGENETVSVTWTASSGIQEIYVKIDPSDDVSEIHETNNMAFRQIEILPDLSLNAADISFSSDNPLNGGSVVISAVVRNIGGTDASDVIVQFFDGNLTNGTQISTNQTIVSIPRAGTGTASVQWNVSAGVHDIHVVIDPSDSIPETNETNNTAFNTITVLPDLEIEGTDITFSNPMDGGNITINATVHNIGGVNATNVTVHFYDGHPLLNGSLIGTKTITNISGGGATNVVYYDTRATLGVHDIYVKLDRNDTIKERDENNNFAFKTTVVRRYPDLTINASDIVFSNNPTPRGEFITIDATVHNKGDGDALGVIVQFYNGNPKVNGTLIGAQTIVSIDAGESEITNITPLNKFDLDWILTSGLNDIYVRIDPLNTISETNESNNIAVNTLNVTENTAPVFSNISISPCTGSWSDEFTYALNVSDVEGDDVSIMLQTFTNGNWAGAETVSLNNTSPQKTATLKHRFTSTDRSQTAKYRFYYHDEVDEGDYHSGRINEGFYPSEAGLSGPTLDNTSYGLGIVEGAGAGQGSSFYSWNADLYTLVQPHDEMFVTASDSINKVGIYDYSDDLWYYYHLNTTYARGEVVNITEASGNHPNHFIRIKVYQDSNVRSFHLIKETKDGGTVEGGYPGYGGSFTTWSTSAYTILLPGDTVYVAADTPVNKLGVFDYADDVWNYYDLINIVPKGISSTSGTMLPKGEAINITSYLQPYQNKFVRIKVLQDETERNFHTVKQTDRGGIVEGAQGDQGGSSFYSWSPSIYTIIQPDDHVYVTADDSFNFIKIIDKTTGEIYREYIFDHGKAEVVDIVSCLQYLPNYINHLIEIQTYNFEVQRNLHLVKITPDGGIVEAGYASSHSSFGSYDSNAYTLFRSGDRILIAANDEFDTLKITNCTDDAEHTISLGSVNLNNTLVDVTAYLYDYEGHFIQLKVYNQASIKNFHVLKVHEKKDIISNAVPVLSDADVSPGAGSWRDEYTYSVNLSDMDGDLVVVTLQVFTNDRWINVKTKSSCTGTLEWTYQFTSLDRSQTARYRFYYDDGRNTGYYPNMSGLSGPELDNTGYGSGIVEGAGTGRGSSFYTWAGDMYTVVQPGDCLYVVADDTINKVGIYDYSDDQWYYYYLDATFVRGELVNISDAGFGNHLNHFIRIKVYHEDTARSFHLIKQTQDSGTVEGGYAGYGGSFTTWSTYANTIINEGDRVWVAADAPVNKIKVLNYTDDQWQEYEIINIVPGHGMHGMRSYPTISPKGEAIEVTSYLEPFAGRFVQIKILQDSTERNFHVIKKTQHGGIVEGADGGTAGSSFYSWYSSLYNSFQIGDRVYVASDGQFNRLRILDKTTGQWDYVNLSRSHPRGEVADVSTCFVNYTNNMLQVQVYNDTTLRNFHLVKVNQDGGIVEGGYPNTDSSFNSWAVDAYTLFRPNDRIIIAPSDYINNLRVYDYVDDQWHTINLGNVYTRYVLVDATPYLSAFKGHFIRLQAYHAQTQVSYHVIKAVEEQEFENAAPVLSDANVSPEAGSWKDEYAYKVNVSDPDGDTVNVTLQVFTNDRWINLETRGAVSSQISYESRFGCTDRNQTAQYRFYYDDGVNTGYYPSLYGAVGPVLDDTSYGMGIVESGGSGYGSSFYTWHSSLYTVVMPGDTVHILPSEPINNVQVYDYTTQRWYTYNLGGSFDKGRELNITELFSDHLNNFVQIKVYYDTLEKSFHIVKQTPAGGMVEGGYPGYGSSFTTWSTYANTIILQGDHVYVTPEYDINKIGIYNYSDDQWAYYNLTTTAPASRLLNISPYVQQYTNRFIKIKVLTESTDRKFHVIKQNSDGGIIEGAEGGTQGSSFYSWYSSMYTTVLDGDSVFVAADNTINKIRIHDYTTGTWQYHNLSRTHHRGEVVDVSFAFVNYTNHIVQIKLYQNSTARNFHLLKITPSGGMVEGGYPNTHSSFNSWAADMYTLFSEGDRLLITPTDYIDSVRIYDYATDDWHTINLGGNVYTKYSLVDITPYIKEFEGRFIRLQVYYLESQKSYHLIKVKQEVESELMPDLTLGAMDIAFSNDNPIENSIIAISATIRNMGSDDATNFMVRFLDGEGGTQIGDDRMIHLIDPNSSETVSVSWNVTSGVHEIYVSVDPMNDVSESNESNNAAFATIEVLPDLTLEAKDISFSALYRMPIVIQENSGDDLTDYQMNLTVDTASLISEGKMRSDCGDIRFKNSSGYEIPYWIESGVNSEDTKIWVKVPYVPANGTATVYMYYGNPMASSASNKTDTFILFDKYPDFTGWSNTATHTCGVTPMMGGYNNFGSGASTQKTIRNLTAGKYLVSFNYYHVDSWDGESERFFWGGVQKWSRSHSGGGSNICGGHWGDSIGLEYGTTSVKITHTGGNATLKFDSTLDQGASDESWGVDNICVRSYTSPEPTPALGSEELVGNTTITATIHNIGGVNATNVTVQFYDGDPDDDGTLIGNRTIDNISRFKKTEFEFFKEDWESGTIDTVKWVRGGSISPYWIVYNSPVYQGRFSSGNNNIGNSQNSWIQTTVDLPTESILTFYWKVSSEGSYDYLRFYIDETERSRISGGVNWQQKIFDLSQGAHTLKWAYTKDGSASSGSDTGWIDNISVCSKVPIAPTISTVTVSIPWNAIPDVHDIYVVIDPENIITERNETNNVAHKVLSIENMPDLTIDSPDISFSNDNPAEGEFVSISAMVYNIGNAPAFNVPVKFYHGEPINGTLIGAQNIAYIPSGSFENCSMTPSNTYNLTWILTNGTRDIYVEIDPSNAIHEQNETNNLASKTINVTENNAPILSNATVSPLTGSWKDEYTYSLNITDIEGDNVSVTLQILTNEHWIDVDTKHPSDTQAQQTLTWSHTFTSVDRNQTARHRFYYEDYVSRDSYHSGVINSGYYPSINGSTGPVLDNTTHSLGIVEGAGSDHGSSFYSWHSHLYTAAQPGDTIFIAASEPVDNIRLYDYTTDQWYTYDLDAIYAGGVEINITSAFENHLNHFVQIKAYSRDSAKNFHAIKQTQHGGTVEGGYPGYGGSFTTWSTYSNVIINDGDRFYVAADNPFNRIGVFDYVDEYWYYYDLGETVQKGVLTNIDPVLQVYTGHAIQIKVLQDATERNFHLIKRTEGGGIVEGAQGNQGGSSFYPWYSSLYTAVQSGDRLSISADNQFNRIRVYDYANDKEETYILDRRYEKSEIADITPFLHNHLNHMVRIQGYHYENLRNIHLVKTTPDGGIVEGGYSSGHASFGSWATDMYTLFRHGDRIIVASNDDTDSVKIYDYADDRWNTIDLGSTYPKYSLIDITPHISSHAGHFIRLQVYHQTSQKSYHLIKVFEKQPTEPCTAPQFSDVSASPDSGSWRDDYTYNITVNSASIVNVTLQVFTNGHWFNADTKTVSNGSLSWDHQFTCIDRNQTAKYRFYYDDGYNTGYYPSASGISGPVLNDVSYGFGIIEGAGTGYGSSFYQWSNNLYTIVQPGDTVYVTPDDSINKVGVYDYTSDQWYYYALDICFKGESANITKAFTNHIDHFVQVRVYHNDIQRNFHIIKQTQSNGTVEGGYPGYGSSFTTWSTYSYTVLQQGDSIFVAADGSANMIGVYDYVDEYWHYYDMNTTPRGESVDITSYLEPYMNYVIQIKILQNSTERNFHIIKKTKQGGIVEGAQGNQQGSSFYLWYSSMYTLVQYDDRVFVAADRQYNNIRVYDYTTEEWENIYLDRKYNQSELSEITPYLKKYANHLIQINVYYYDVQRNFHTIKKTRDGGIVEGGYPSSHASFGSWSNEAYTLFRPSDRIMIAPNDYIDTIKVYDYTDSNWYTYQMRNMHPKYHVVDITPYIASHEGHFIKLELYHQQSKKNFHTIKAFGETRAPPAITLWSNDKTNDDSLHITVNESESVRFNATADQTITTWNWFKDGVHQSNNVDNYTTSWSVNGTHNVSVNATNANGTSDAKTWMITVSSCDYDPADTNHDCVVDMMELMAHISKWKRGEVGMMELMTSIGRWKLGAGGYC